MSGQLSYIRLNEIRDEIEKEWGQQPPIWVTDLYAAAERCTCSLPDPNLVALAASLGYSHGGLCTCDRCEQRHQASLRNNP